MFSICSKFSSRQKKQVYYTHFLCLRATLKFLKFTLDHLQASSNSWQNSNVLIRTVNCLDRYWSVWILTVVDFKSWIFCDFERQKERGGLWLLCVIIYWIFADYYLILIKRNNKKQQWKIFPYPKKETEFVVKFTLKTWKLQ